jgi:hypothetical protein
MGIFNYNGKSNEIDESPKPDSNGTQIATTEWVRDRIAEISHTGNCATGQIASTGSIGSTGSTSTVGRTN